MANRKKEIYKPKPMTEGKRNIIQGLLQEYDIETADDIQDALKDLLSGTIQEMLEAEMDDHLGYVDFKLWKETMTVSAEEEKKNIQAKLDKCGGKRAVIINIMLDHNMQITSSDHGRIIEIPYLYRLDRKEIGIEIIAKINREGYLQ